MKQKAYEELSDDKLNINITVAEANIKFLQIEIKDLKKQIEKRTDELIGNKECLNKLRELKQKRQCYAETR